MKEEIISFETAQFKKLGFDSNCGHLYVDRSDDDFVQLTEMFCDLNFTKERPFYIAPTQSLLQKWIREHHGLEVFVMPSDTENEYGYVILETPALFVENIEDGYDSYDGALEQGLLYSVKYLWKHKKDTNE